MSVKGKILCLAIFIIYSLLLIGSFMIANFMWYTGRHITSLALATIITTCAIVALLLEENVLEILERIK